LSSTKKDPKNNPAMSAQQKRFTSGGLGTYKRFMVGDSSWLSLGLVELYNLFVAPLPGLIGIGLRSLCLPLLLGKTNGRATVGRGVSFRLPKKTQIGKACIIDDFATVDVRDNSTEDETSCGIEIGDNVFVGRNTILAAKGGTLKLDRAVNISSNCRLATQTNIQVGESTLIGAYAYIGPGNHLPATADKALIEQDMEKKGGVQIGKSVWIGTRATILDGVRIGDGAIVGAHSLVKDNVAANSIVAGCPAKVIGKS